MFPAARKGDPITHDLLAPSGVVGPPITGPCPPPKWPVMVEGLPAAHINCTVVCSGAISGGLAHPPPPGPPPPIVIGSPTVFIHGMPAARWALSGDVGACGVFLGDPKLAAARTVLIGGPVFPFPVRLLPNGQLQVGNNITIQGNRDYQAKVLRDLHIMSNPNFPTGLARLNNLDRLGQPIRIRPGAVNATIPDNDLDAAARGRPSWGGGVGTGRGTGSTINYNPDREPPTTAVPSIRRPADVGLHHELTHAEHMARGVEDASPDLANPSNPNIDETRVIDQDNRYRGERGIPSRANHTVL